MIVGTSERRFCCFLALLIIGAVFSAKSSNGEVIDSLLGSGGKYGETSFTHNGQYCMSGTSRCSDSTTTATKWHNLITHDSKDGVSGVIKFHGFFDKRGSIFLLSVLNTLKEERPIFVDVGANLGWFTLLAASKGYRVFAIEASPCNFCALRTGIRLNGWDDRIVPNNVAITHKSEATYICMDAPIMNAKTTINHGNIKISKEDFKRSGCSPELAVPTIEMDDLVPRDSKIGILKLDCEGCEGAALASARELISGPNPPCAIMMEWSVAMVAAFQGGLSVAESRQTWLDLVSAGYEFVDMHKKQMIPTKDTEKFFSSKFEEVYMIHTSEGCFGQSGSSRRDLLFANVTGLYDGEDFVSNKRKKKLAAKSVGAMNGSKKPKRID